MTRNARILTAVFAAGGLFGWFATSLRQPTALAQPPAAAATAASGAEAGIKAITADYAKAFNAGDAKAAATLWTTDGDYTSDGETFTGRAAIEQSLVELFKAMPKAAVDIRVESVKHMGRGLANVEGVVTFTVPGAAPTESKYTALHVLEDGKWLAASVSEWVPDPATDVSLKNLEWMTGEWVAKGDAGAEVKIVYAWDEDKSFITGKYSVTNDGKTISKGTQVFGRNPGGGLRSWMFDSTGTTADGVWYRDETRWVNETTGVTPDGTEVSTVNVIVPLGPDAFTWQTTDRVIDGVAAAPLPPIKVTRVKK